MPLLIGQGIKASTNFRGHRLPLNTISQCALLFVIYTTFCDTFLVPETGLSALDVICAVFSGKFIIWFFNKTLTSIFSVLILQLTLMGISFKISRYFRSLFLAQDVIAIVFCSTHKSLTLGKFIFNTLQLKLLTLIHFRHSHFKNNVPRLRPPQPDQPAIVGLPSDTDNTWWVDSIATEGLGAHAEK